jgi:hypothetical protein
MEPNIKMKAETKKMEREITEMEGGKAPAQPWVPPTVYRLQQEEK